MPNWNLGGDVNKTSGYSGSWPASSANYVRSGDYGMPTARLNLFGNQPIYIGTIYAAYTSGPFTGAQLEYQGNLIGGGNLFASSGGVCALRFTFFNGGRLYFGRNTGNGLTTTFGRGGNPLTGGLVGSFDWAQVASAPQSLVVAPGPSSGSIAVSWAAPADNGGSGISAYDVQYATSLAGPWTSAGTTGATSASITPPPGASYYVRVIANNGVGSSQAVASTTPVAPTGGGKRYSGTAFIPLSVARRYSGTAWVNLVTRKRFNGTSWVNIT